MTDPVMEVDVMNSYYNDGRMTTRHEVKFRRDGEVPAWHHGDELLSTGFYYWDETWGSCYGPFEDEDDCRASLAVYCDGIK